MTSTDVCETWVEKLAARKPEDLSPAERRALNAHVASCSHCSAIRQDYDLLTTGIRTLSTHAVRFSPPDPANAPWHTQQLEFSGRERRSRERFGQTIRRMIWESPTRRMGVGIALAVASILIALLTLFQGYSSLQELAPVAVKQATTTAGARGFTNVCPQPPNQSNANCQARYIGSYMSALNHSTTSMTLFLQQKHSVISGSCMLPPPFNPASILISGSIDEKGNIKFDVHISSPNLIIYFTGSGSPDGSIQGTYTTSTDQHGTWVVKLSQPQ